MFGFHELDVDTLKQWLEKSEPLRLVDVRTPAEMSRGVISGAELLPLHLLPLKVSEFSPEQRIVFYCQSGARSAQACAFLTQHGFESVYNLRGGVSAWARMGYPLSPPPSDV